MKKTWIIILVLAMMMTVVLATGCGEDESPAPETPEPEPVAVEPADDDDDEMQKGGSGLSDGFDLEGADFKAVGELGEADDAQFKINPNNIESARP